MCAKGPQIIFVAFGAVIFTMGSKSSACINNNYFQCQFLACLCIWEPYNYNWSCQLGNYLSIWGIKHGGQFQSPFLCMQLLIGDVIGDGFFGKNRNRNRRFFWGGFFDVFFRLFSPFLGGQCACNVAILRWYALHCLHSSSYKRYWL